MRPRGRAVARLLAVALLVGSALSFRTAFAGLDTEPPGVGGGSPSPTPLWSARRVPSLVVDSAGAQRLAAALDAVLAPHDACAVVEQRGKTLVARGDDAPLAPASTEKLLTAAGALEVFGADHRFRTQVVAGAAPGPGGVVAGDLWLVGGGDPLLATPGYRSYLSGNPRSRLDPVTPLADLADAVVAAGVRRIDGRVLGDDSRHEAVRYLPSWKPSYRTAGDVGPLGALVVDDGFINPRTRVPASDPAVHAADALAGLLGERGVTVTRGTGRGAAPAGAAVVATVDSVPLGEVVAGMLTSSDNLTAEVLAREVGLAEAGSGTTEAGTAAVVQAAGAAGVPVEGVHLLDGSGLAPDNRVTCRALAETLALGDRDGFGVLRSGLAVAGQTGTLSVRFVDHPLNGRLRAKTGQIAGVVGLAGVVEEPGGGVPLTFAFVANGAFSMTDGWVLQQQVAEAVDAFPAVPAAGELVPLPGAR